MLNSDKSAAAVTDIDEISDTSLESEGQDDATSEVETQGRDSGGRFRSSGTPSARKRGKYRPRPQPELIELDPSFLESPERMNYALLLALLLRDKGTISLTHKELQHTDTEYNIVFAVSLDGQHLEVRAVSAESGIIRSPEAKWAPNQATPAAQTYTAPPLPPGDSELLAQLQYLHQNDIKVISNEREGSLPPDQEHRIVEMTPSSRPTAPRPSGQTGGPGYAFPFENGQSPDTATATTLDALTATMLRRDQATAMEEQRAAERVERGE